MKVEFDFDWSQPQFHISSVEFNIFSQLIFYRTVLIYFHKIHICNSNLFVPVFISNWSTVSSYWFQLALIQTGSFQSQILILKKVPFRKFSKLLHRNCNRIRGVDTLWQFSCLTNLNYLWMLQSLPDKMTHISYFEIPFRLYQVIIGIKID